MDRTVRAFVIVACAMISLGVGWYLYSEYRNAQSEKAALAAISEAQADAECARIKLASTVHIEGTETEAQKRLLKAQLLECQLRDQAKLE